MKELERNAIILNTCLGKCSEEELQAQDWHSWMELCSDGGDTVGEISTLR